MQCGSVGCIVSSERCIPRPPRKPVKSNAIRPCDQPQYRESIVCGRQTAKSRKTKLDVGRLKMNGGKLWLKACCPFVMDNPTKTAQDAKRINIHEDYEVRYWTKRFGVTPEQLKAAVHKVGVMVDDVERELKHK